MIPLPTVSATATRLLDLDVDTLIVPAFRGGIPGPGATEVLRELGLPDVPRDAGFRGRLGETQVLAGSGLRAERVVVVGLGRMDELDADHLRQAAGAAVRAVATCAEHVATTLVETNPGLDAVAAVAEGMLLGAHRDERFRSQPKPATVSDVALVLPSTLLDEAAEALPGLAAAARAEATARELVTSPAAALGPADVVAWARESLPDVISIEAWDEDRLAQERCGGILAVGQGSARPPRLLITRYRPAAPVATVALVGKGIVFDSGGLSLKQPSGMETMKSDMGGAAAVLAVMQALPELDADVEVIGICALAENSPSGVAQHPGDVFAARNGMTVQVLNTDAEGRLVLADALSYAAEQGVDAIVDIATLTGAVWHAVGRRAIGIFGNDDDLLDALLHAARSAGEPMWHLPLWDDLRDALDSDVADLDNVNYDHGGGATVAGLFLREFVGGQPWAHLDIAGAAFASEDRGHRAKQGTGAAVRTLLRWIQHRA